MQNCKTKKLLDGLLHFFYLFFIFAVLCACFDANYSFTKQFTYQLKGASVENVTSFNPSQFNRIMTSNNLLSYFHQAKDINQCKSFLAVPKQLLVSRIYTFYFVHLRGINCNWSLNSTFLKAFQCSCTLCAIVLLTYTRGK